MCVPNWRLEISNFRLRLCGTCCEVDLLHEEELQKQIEKVRPRGKSGGDAQAPSDNGMTRLLVNKTMNINEGALSGRFTSLCWSFVAGSWLYIRYQHHLPVLRTSCCQVYKQRRSASHNFHSESSSSMFLCFPKLTSLKAGEPGSIFWTGLLGTRN